MEITMSIAVNRSTKQLVGYWTPPGKTVGIVVTDYSVSDLQKKFDKAAELYKKEFPTVSISKDKNGKSLIKKNTVIIGE
jgi:hypothetical protein